MTVAFACGADGWAAAPPSFPVLEDLQSLVRLSPIIIVGKVVGVQAGRISGEGDARLKFNDVKVSVESRLKGNVRPVVILEQIAVTGRTVTSEVGPSYRKSERYLLFLRPGEGNRYVTAPQGRYFLIGGVVRPTEPGFVADKIKGMKESKVIEEIAIIIRGTKNQP